MSNNYNMSNNKDNKISYTTTLNANLVKEFRVYCAINQFYQNEILEKLISELLNSDSSLSDTLSERTGGSLSRDNSEHTQLHRPVKNNQPESNQDVDVIPDEYL